MSTSVIPALITALVTQADAALAVTVYDGFGVSEEPGDFLMIGVDDADVPGMANSAASTQSPATMGTPRSRDEDGTITCLADSWNGDGDQAGARTAAFATVAAVENLVRSTGTPAMGVAGVYRVGVVSHQLLQDQDTTGARAVVVFQLGFAARL